MLMKHKRGWDGDSMFVIDSILHGPEKIPEGMYYR